MHVYRPHPRASLRAGFGELGEEEAAQPRLFLVFLTKVLCHSYKPRLAAGLSFSLGICTIWGAGFSMWEPLFCTEVMGFFREPVWCLLPSFSFLNLCKRLQPPSSPGMPQGCPPIAAWAGGRWNLPRVGMCQFSNPAKVGVRVCACMLQGKGKAGGLLPFAVGLKRGWA